MNTIIFWKWVLWSTPVITAIIAAILMLIASYNIDRLEKISKQSSTKNSESYKKQSIQNQDEIKIKLDELSSIVLPNSLDISKLSYEDKMAYNAIISQIFNELQPKSRIKINDQIKGLISGKTHNIDISVRSTLENEEILTVIQTSAESNRIDIDQLKTFSDTLSDISAAKGFIISNAGFTNSSVSMAPALGIELLSIIDAKSTKWADDIKIPVLAIQPNLTMSVQLDLAEPLSEGNKIETNVLDWKVSLDGGVTTTLMKNLCISTWEKNKLSKKSQQSHDIKINLEHMLLLINGRDWIKTINAAVIYHIMQEGFLKYNTANQYRAIKNHLTGDIIPTYAEFQYRSFEKNDGWVRVKNIEKMRKRSKGILLVITKNIETINDIGSAKAKFE
jgi:hypothetical protein